LGDATLHVSSQIGDLPPGPALSTHLNILAIRGALTWTGADLFGELAVHIALAAKALDGQVLCVACGKVYQPRRLVVKRGFNYFPAAKCQREAAEQRARRYRDRKRSAPRGSVRDLPYRGLFQERTNDPLFSQ
jgi:hypothetical protein